MRRRKPGPTLTAEELKAKRKRDFWTLDIPLVFGLALCTTFTVIEIVRAFDGNGRALAYAFQWPTIGAIIVWIWFRYKREGLPRANDDETSAGETSPSETSPHATSAEQPGTPPRMRRSLGFADHYRAKVEEAGAEYAAALHAADKVDHAPVIPETDEGLRDWQAYVADLNRREPPGHPPTSAS
jgi:hypothetical protein